MQPASQLCQLHLTLPICTSSDAYIGRSKANSIVLGESTVSESHADIHIISRGGKLTVYITDSQSKTGTLLNGALLRGEADLKNGDILTIGEHYELYVIIVNPIDLGLKPLAEFSGCDSTPAANNPAMPYTPNATVNMMGRPNPGFPQGARQPMPGTPVYNGLNSGNATVVDGQAGAAVPAGGHTVVMGNSFGTNGK